MKKHSIKWIMYWPFTMIILLLFSACGEGSESGLTNGEESTIQEICNFSDVTVAVVGTTIDCSAEYHYLGGFRVKENGFVYQSATEAPLTLICNQSDKLHGVLSNLSPSTEYTIYAYIVAGGRTYKSKVVHVSTQEQESTPSLEERLTFETIVISEKGMQQATAKVSYTTENLTKVLKAGFKLREGNSTTETTYTCSGNTPLQYAFTNLKAATSYTVYAFVTTESNTWYSSSATFQTDEEISSTPSKARYTGWAELPDEVTHANWYYVYHMRPDAPAIRNYAVCYDASYRCTVWAAMAVHTSWSGGAGRNDTWQYDPELNSSLQPNLKKSYSGVYSRGHMIASSDRQVSAETNRQTFYYTNMAPQYQNEFNGGIWNKLEQRVWSNYNCSDTLYVVTGAYFANTNTTCTDNDGKQVVVPTHFYKVLLRSKSGTTNKAVWDLSASELQCVGFWFPHNTSYSTSATVSAEYLVPVSYIEQQTGLTFFPNVPKAPKTQYDKVDWGF
jgi:DNA/RNA endonuclease G (NUC1)